MCIPHVALVSVTNTVGHSFTARIAAALQTQVLSDLEPVWKVTASVNAFEKITEIPSHYWIIEIRDDIDRAGRGTHRERDGKPFALVSASVVHPETVFDRVPLSCSHELLEMLTDPCGDRFIQSLPPPGAPNPEPPYPPFGPTEIVDYLVEICDPCQGHVDGYEIDGLKLCNFCTPRFYDPQPASGVDYIAKKKVASPRTLRPKGYVTIRRPDGTWWQIHHYGKVLATVRMNVVPLPGESWREAVDRESYKIFEGIEEPSEFRAAREVAQLESRLRFAELEQASRARAATFNETVQVLLAANQ